ncbi:GNAT family N-acetyltransferase [Tautonia sociabilis]|uniref:N-acetyltransferase n=1 Tax=Tautonia sociabilis TaxID=2080755 RepID=A0A432ME78_9BACT|nr:GNAT family N-acetyltransferase [Tautonia sociabilis]RUL83510.1 N-acetyltransferase [Tautonia sociabilis]
MAEWRIVRLSRTHVRQGFDCGKPTLDEFLHRLVSQYEKRDLGRTYVALRGDEPRVLGYYTLASGAIETERLPASQAKKLPRHPVPVVLLARLAVDRSVHGQGLGGFLLRDSLSRSLDLSEKLGIHAVVVDALDGEARAFYERFGFLRLTDDALRLFLPLSTIRAAAKPS